MVQQLRRLARRRSSRLEAGAFLVDGPVLVADALDAGVGLRAAYVEEGAVPDLAARLGAAGVPVHAVAPGVLARVTDTVSPQGIVAVAERTAAPGRAGGEPLVVVLAGVGDPGNAGTLLRSAEAAGASAVWAAAGSVDLWAPKVVRASAGALFHVPVRDGVEPADVRAAGLTVVGTSVRDGVAYERADLTGPCALVLGNEAHGLDDAWRAAVDRWVTIPMAGRAESLNVAMAGTLVCFEAARQRRSGE
jgi:TrmH family RNA methyltransferase